MLATLLICPTTYGMMQRVLRTAVHTSGKLGNNQSIAETLGKSLCERQIKKCISFEKRSVVQAINFPIENAKKHNGLIKADSDIKNILQKLGSMHTYQSNKRAFFAKNAGIPLGSMPIRAFTMSTDTQLSKTDIERLKKIAQQEAFIKNLNKSPSKAKENIFFLGVLCALSGITQLVAYSLCYFFATLTNCLEYFSHNHYEFLSSHGLLRINFELFQFLVEVLSGLFGFTAVGCGLGWMGFGAGAAGCLAQYTVNKLRYVYALQKLRKLHRIKDAM